MSMTIHEAHGADDLHRCHPVLLELRPHHADADAFVVQALRQQAEAGYRVFFSEQDGCVAAVAGFRMGENLAWGRFLYVDDLITANAARKQGHARALLEALILEARAKGCKQLHLDSGVQRFDAHRLYLNAGMRISSHHFALEV